MADVEKKKEYTFYQQRIADEVTNINKLINAYKEDDVVRMPERVFIYGYLPLFAGEENPNYDVTFDMWKTYAGGVFNEVAVVDEHNVELFRVPALFDRNKLSPILNGRKISDVVETAGQYARIHPNQGMAYLNNELSNRAMIMKQAGDNIINLERWNAIFRRYGKPEIMSIKEKKTIAADNNIGNDDYFEPL